jgi:hypothetical protein
MFRDHWEKTQGKPDHKLVMKDAGQKAVATRRRNAAARGEPVKVVSFASKASIPPLRAHQTRWTQRLERATTKKARREAEQKIAEYEERIAAIVAQTG